MGGEVVVSERMTMEIADVMDVSVDDDATVGVEFQGRPILGLLVPAMNGTAPKVQAEVTRDGGGSWVDLLESDGSTQALEISAGAAVFAVSSDDLSPLAAYVGGRHVSPDVMVRLVCDVAQTADRTFRWLVVA